MSLDPIVSSDGPAPLAGDEDSVDSRSLRLAVRCDTPVVPCWGGEVLAREGPADPLSVSKSCKEDHSSSSSSRVSLPGVPPDCHEGPAIAGIVKAEKAEVVAARGSSAELLDLSVQSRRG